MTYEHRVRPAEIRWMKLLDRKVVENLSAYRIRAGAEAAYLDIGPVELKVTESEARYFIPHYLVDEFVDLQVNFAVV